MANWLRGVLTFVASSLDINGCVLSYFEGTANVQCCSFIHPFIFIIIIFQNVLL